MLSVYGKQLFSISFFFRKNFSRNHLLSSFLELFRIFYHCMSHAGLDESMFLVIMALISRHFLSFSLLWTGSFIGGGVGGVVLRRMTPVPITRVE